MRVILFAKAAGRGSPTPAIIGIDEISFTLAFGG